MEVDTSLGRHPFEFVGLERREGGLVVAGRLAGLRADLVLGPPDLCAALAAAAALLAIGAGLAHLRGARCRSSAAGRGGA